MNWKQLQGQSVDGDFSLVEHLGGTDQSATFMAAGSGDAKAAVKLSIAADQNTASLLARWKTSESLSHPHLLRVFRSGSCVLNGTEFLFLAIEYAEENLSQVLPQRALTPDEVREMLPPVLDVLQYLHGEHLVHGNLKPSNIMAAGDQLKLSADSVMRLGEPLRDTSPYTAPEAASGVVPASDLWSLGVTLTEILTQRRPTWEPGSTLAQLPDNMPDQIRVLVQRCLIPDPALRGSIDDIRERLKPPVVVPLPSTIAKPVKSKRSPLRFALPAGFMAVAIGAFIAISHKPDNPAQPEPSAPQAATPEPTAAPVQSPPPAVLTEATDPRPVPEPEKAEPEKPQKLEVLMPAKSSAAIAPPRAEPAKASPAPKATTASRTGTDGVVHQVLPDIPSKAMRTINGKFRVEVKVRVNREGDVVASEFVSRGPSKYFADRTMEAAKEWKFSPAESSQRAWNIEFEFRRSGVTTNPTQIDR